MSEAMQSCREMTKLEILFSRVKGIFRKLRRKLPYFVWWDEELDVVVTLSQDKLNPEKDPFKQLLGGAFAQIEKTFSEMGITFDKGMGFDGRDWEWDWSLSGPISVRFHGTSSKPELRMERPKLKLIVNNKNGAA